EQQVLSCGHCDNCLNSRINRQQLVDTDLQSIRQALQKGGKTMGHLCRQFAWSKSRAEKTLSHLMREQRVQEEAEKYIWKGYLEESGWRCAFLSLTWSSITHAIASSIHFVY